MSILVNKQIKTTGQAINDLNEAVVGMDPVNGVLARTYNAQAPLQDRVDILEQAAAGLQVTKYIGPISIVSLGIPVAVSGQAAIDLLDALIFAYKHPNDKKGIGLVVDVPIAIVNDPINFPDATNILYTVTLTSFAGQIDTSGHTKVLLQGDSPEFKFEITTTINYANESFVTAPSLTMYRISIKAENVIIAGSTLDVEMTLKADATNKATILGSGTTTDIINEVTDARLIAPKVIKDYAEPKITDTGWLSASMTENVESGTIKYRKVGNMVQVRVVVKLADTLINPTYATLTEVLPVGYRPTENHTLPINVFNNDTYGSNSYPTPVVNVKITNVGWIGIYGGESNVKSNYFNFTFTYYTN